MSGPDGFRQICTPAVPYWEAVNIARSGVAVHAFCGRRGGCSSGRYGTLNISGNVGDEDENIRRNVEIIAATFAMRSEQFLFIDQIHGTEVLVIKSSEGLLPAAAFSRPYDACVTDKPEVALCIKTADCVPVLLIDVKRRVIGAVHAGWRGTAGNIVSRTIDVMVAHFSCNPDDVTAALGPSIGPCCYEVDETVMRVWDDEQSSTPYFRPAREGGKWMLDLSLANAAHLESRGVPRNRIARAGLCTACRQEHFFSHRAAGGRTGRQMSFIMLKAWSGEGGNERKFLTKRA